MLLQAGWSMCSSDELFRTGLSPLFAFLNYGQEWKRSRRHFHQCFNANILPEYAPVQSKAARGLLRGILKSTADVGVLAKL